MIKAELEKEFRNRFHRSPAALFFCPGRVNLIGEHIDYNGGKVMPFTISRGTYLAVGKNTDRQFRLQSLGFPEQAAFPAGMPYSKQGPEWFYYPLGVLHELQQQGHRLEGMDMLFTGDLPVGAGLSSSASVEVLMAYACTELFSLGISRKDMALIGKKAENEFIGVNSGIMDQFAVALGEENKVLLLDCDTLEYSSVPFETGPYQPVIINSNKQRSLAESKYNERFAECRQALADLQQALPVQHLCELDMNTFQQHAHLISNPVAGKRAFHVISENERVKAALTALNVGDMRRLGQLLNESHQSLKDAYEVSGRELDTIAAFCRDFDGCAGGRMTGAGFGGCAIALVLEERIAVFAEQLRAYYKALTGYEAEIVPTAAGAGVNII